MQRTTMDNIADGGGAKRHAPATLRNRDAIAAVLHDELPTSGLVLEIASGSGEHVVYFAQMFTNLDWQPSDQERGAIESIYAHFGEYEGTNLRLPMVIDAQAPGGWELPGADAIVCINMAHISPWDATIGLFEGAARILSGKDAPLILYGPFFEHGTAPAPSNVAFDQSLRERDPAWGVRNVEDLGRLAAENGLRLTVRKAMPANNLMLVYRGA